MKKLLCAITLAAALLPGIGLSEITPVNLSASVSLNKSEIQLLSGEKSELKATVENGEAVGKADWSSSNTSVVSVKGGVVTAKHAGEAEVTCSVTLENGNVVTAVCSVSVSKPVKQIVFAKEEITIYNGEVTDPLSVSVRPGEACQELSWSSSNEAVATVDDQGRVTAHQAGHAVITATSEEISSSGPKKGKIRVNVKQHAESLALSKEEVTISCRQAYQLSCTVLPKNASNKKVVWHSSDASIASVSSNGKVVGRNPGTAEIQCMSRDGTSIQAVCKVHVTQAVKGIRLLHKEAKLAVGETVTAQVEFSPENAENKSVAWSSTNEAVATVDENGVITAVAKGHCRVNVTTTDGSAKSSIMDIYVN